MKVIAKTSGGFLVEVPSDEMPKLKGFEGAYGDYEVPNIGEEINTTKFYSHILGAISAQSQIKNRANQLRTLACDLDKIEMPEIFRRG